MVKINKTLNWNGQLLEIGIGEIANSTDGSAIVKMGNTIVLCTCTAAREVAEERDFFPLTVHYREMAFAAGKIPGGFIKREGKTSEREILASRVIDRAIRPLFASSFFNEVQIICTVLSYDSEHNPDILSLIGSSIAIINSGLPFEAPVAAIRLGKINNQLVINPSHEQLKNSDLDLIVAATKESIVMVEAEANLVTNEEMLDAIQFAQSAIAPVIDFIEEIGREFSKPQWEIKHQYLDKLKEVVKIQYKEDFDVIVDSLHKKSRKELTDQLIEKAAQEFAVNNEYSKHQVAMSIKAVESDLMRHNILTHNKRVDGRRTDEIRPISGKTALLPSAHGSALFTRGETQALVVTTLGTAQDEQLVESLSGEYKERFMLNYFFLPYCTGEIGALRAGPGRREIGHGKLAWKAFSRIIPDKSAFPYSIRVVSEITSCNGSTSMATVCGTSMSLMDAGVNIKTPIAGIAMGLIKEKDKHAILSDIMGLEDVLGDMDFKVAGSKDAITALQLDIKITGLPFNLIKEILSQAKEGITHILSEMEKSISYSKSAVSHLAPSMHTMKIDKDKIREVIGSGGKVIKEISESNSAKIDISDDGTVSIAAPTREKLEATIDRITSIVRDPQMGDVYDASVVKVLDSLAFVNYISNKEGILHISETPEGRDISSMNQILKQGDIIRVKIIGFDMKGKAKLTTKLDKVVGQHKSSDAPHRERSSNKPSHSYQNQGGDKEQHIKHRSGARKWNKQHANNQQSDDHNNKPERKYFS